MSRLNEDGEGVASGVTQVSNVGTNKLDTFGSKKKNVNDVYNKLFELDDYKNKNKDNTQYAGSAKELVSSLERYANDTQFSSQQDRELYSKFAEIIKSRFKDNDSITILHTSTGYKIVLNLDI